MYKQNTVYLQTLIFHKLVKGLFRLLIGRGNGADGRCVNDELLLAVQAKQGVANFQIEGSDGAGAQPECGAGQVQILTNVTGIDQGNPMRPNAVAPFAAVGQKTSIKNYAGFRRPMLPFEGERYRSGQIFHRMQEFELVT